MKIDRILLLACDRPDYLRDSLARCMTLGIEIIAVLDKPSNLGRIQDWKKCEAILKTAGVFFIKNSDNLGCSNSMYLLLDQRHEGNNLVIEDDIILKDSFESEIANLEFAKPFIAKLSLHYWGWVASGCAIDRFKQFRNKDNTVVSKKMLQSLEYQAIEIFQRNNTFFPWDELLNTCSKLSGIKVHEGFDLAENIGEFSSRKQNKSEGATKFCIFKNGVIHKFGQIN